MRKNTKKVHFGGLNANTEHHFATFTQRSAYRLNTNIRSLLYIMYVVAQSPNTQTLTLSKGHTMKISPLLTRALPLGLVAAMAFGTSACGEEYTYDSNSFFLESWESDYTKISNCAASPTHSGDFVTVFADTASAPSYADNTIVPQGGVIMKAQYSDDACTDLGSITAMRKGAAGTAAETGDWEWQRVKGDGSVAEEGQLSACVNCHTGCSTDDYRCQK